MDLLIAIGMLCNTPTGLKDLYHVHSLQTKCHKHYLECYLGKTKIEKETITQEKAQKFLYTCVLENPHGISKQEAKE